MRIAAMAFFVLLVIGMLSATVSALGLPSLQQLPTVASIPNKFLDAASLMAHDRSGQGDSCSNASSAFLWFLKVLQNCTQQQRPHQHTAPLSDNNLCGMLDTSGFFTPDNSDQLPWLQPYLSQHNISATMLSPTIVSGLNLLLSAQSGGGGSMGAQAVSLGEVAYILGQVVQGWASLLSNGASTSSKFWSVWTQGWMDGANRIISAREDLSPAEMLRVANYLFVAMQPFPVSPLGQQAFNASYDWMFRHLNAMQREGRLKFNSVSIPYTTDDGVSLTLPGIAVTPTLTSGGQQSLPPLVIATAGGFDFPLPGEVVRSLYAYLDAGFAMLIYEGPGQGRTLYNQAHPLRFTPRWDRVLSAVASFAETQLPTIMPYNTSAGVTAVSESFGGFLIPQACSAIDPATSIIKGCIADPATSSFAFALNYILAGRFIAPFQTVNTTILNTLCGPYCADYAANYFGVSATSAPLQALFSMDPLMSAMTSSSCALGRNVWQGLFQIIVAREPSGIFPSDLMYMVLALVPPGPDTYADIDHLVKIFDKDPATTAKLLVDGIARIQNYFVAKDQVESTRVSIAAFGGTQDFVYESQATKEYFATLPMQVQGLLKIFDKSSGAAGHCEVGAWQVVWPYYLQFVRAVALGQL